MLRAPLVAALALALACGSGSNGATSSTPYAVTLLAYSVTPATPTAPPGAAVLFQNLDQNEEHLLVSDASTGAAQEASASFPLFLSQDGDTVWTIPASAPAGTAVPYHCQIHGTIETGTITVGP